MKRNLILVGTSLLTCLAVLGFYLSLPNIDQQTQQIRHLAPERVFDSKARPVPVTEPANSIAQPEPTLPRQTTPHEPTNPVSLSEDPREVTDAQTQEAKSEEWVNYVLEELEPAMASNDFEALTAAAAKVGSEKALFAHACLIMSDNDTQHPAWQAFMDWTEASDGDREDALTEMRSHCVQELPIEQ